MIRNSAGLAFGALTLSIMVHFLGVGLTFDAAAPPRLPDVEPETIALGDSFDEIVDVQLEPVEPEPPEVVEEPEPEAQETPEPEDAEAPTTEVLVASPDPRPTLSPDTGVSQTVTSDVTEPVEPQTIDGPETEPVDPSDGDAADLANPLQTSPITPDPADTSDTAPQIDAAEAPSSEEAPAVQSPVTTSSLAEALEPEAPAAPVPDVIAALPLDDVQPSVDAESSEAETDQGAEGVTTSLRPQARPRDLPTQDAVAPVENADNDASRSPDLVIESPLTAYSRDGVDVFAGRRSTSRSQSSFGGGRGPGNNSDVTNYAGQVLVHLNRTAPVAVSARGWARVSFRINPDGTLASVDIIDGSGSPDIDRAARTQVRRGVPFPRPPGGESRLLSFVYSLR